MALADELTALVARAGRGVLDDATSFGAALDDYLAPEAASRGVLNLLVDAVRQGALARLLRDIEHGAEPARAVAASGDQLARDRASSESASSRWAVALLGYAAGVVDRPVLDAQADPASTAAPQTSPQARPPVASPPPPLPPTARPAGPPVAAAPYAPPQWSPAPSGYPGPSPLQRPRRRTGLVLGAVGLAAALVAGGVVTAIVLTSDDPRARTVDDPTIATVTSADTPSDDSDDVLTAADPVAVAQLLTEVATESFPGGSAPEISAQSWSVAADNLTDGFPRDLAVGERDEATDWLVRTTVGGRALSIDVEHEPPDGGTFYDWSCDTFTSSGDTERECKELETSDGRTAIEYWYRDREVGIATHAAVIPSDYATEQPQVLVTERLPDAPKGVTLAELKATLQLTGEELLAIAEDPRLHLPRPAIEPPLPSYGYCVNTQPRPAACPEGIS